MPAKERQPARANWRVIFRFDEGAEDVDYVEYH
jgi:plasmid maintenance system killer protein